MCRRRIIAIFLSLALMASCFVISVSAEEQEYYDIRISINGIARILGNGVGASFTIPAHSTMNFTIPWLNIPANALSQNQSLSVSFNIRLYALYYSTSNPNHMSNANIRPSSSQSYFDTGKGFISIQNMETIDPDFSPDIKNLCTYQYVASFLFTQSGQVNTNVTTTWENLSNNSITVYFVVEDLDISNSFNWFFSSILSPAIVVMNNHLSAIHNAIDSLNQAFILDDYYSYNTIYYDEDGNAHVQEVLDVSWVESIQGMLFAISQPVVHQVQQEQMARDAGFEDVLEDAYDHSSPGDFLDFLSIGSIATWDEGVYENAQGDAITYWFSQSCKDNIDSVPVVRGEEPQIIDFYSAHISEYWEALGIDTTDSGGD